MNKKARAPARERSERVSALASIQTEAVRRGLEESMHEHNGLAQWRVDHVDASGHETLFRSMWIGVMRLPGLSDVTPANVAMRTGSAMHIMPS